MTINDVVEKYDGRELLLHTSVLEDDEGYCPFLLIEGKKDTLKKLAEMILAVTEETGDKKIFISPDGAGSAHFTKDSTFGLYINGCVANFSVG